MITYEEKKLADLNALETQSLAHKQTEEKLKKGFKTMKKGSVIVLVNPKNFDSKLEQGYNFTKK